MLSEMFCPWRMLRQVLSGVPEVVEPTCWNHVLLQSFVGIEKRMSSVEFPSSQQYCCLIRPCTPIPYLGRAHRGGKAMA
jgi:hypothetical protein